MRKKDIFKAILINRSERQLFDIFQPVVKKSFLLYFVNSLTRLSVLTFFPAKFYDKYLIFGSIFNS